MSNEDPVTAPPAAPGNTRYTLGDKLAATVFMCVMLAGAWQLITASRKVEWRDLPHGWTAFREGETARAAGAALTKNMPARPALIAGANGLRYLLLRGGGDQVRVGHEDWLFLTDELRYYPDAQTHLMAHVKLMAGAASALDRDGVTLVVVLVPDKARIYQDHMIGGRIPDYNRSRYDDALNGLRRRHVNVVDLLTPLAKGAADAEVYYRSDTHWNQAGARIAAEAIAAEVRRLNIALDTATFTTEASAEKAERPGDLIRLMGLEHAPDFLRPKADYEALQTTSQTGATDTGGLFGDAPVPVVLAGTSYSLRANFQGFLEQALSAKVLDTAKDGGGFLQAMTQYLKDESFRSSRPRVLIWEVPERVLGEALDGEQDWLQQAGLHP